MGQLFKNKQIIHLVETDSTNTYLSNNAGKLPQGSVVTADFQKNGRGQGANRWESNKGENLTFSIIFNPLSLKAVQQFYISKAISLAVSDYISLYTDKVSIKWPNDIYVEDRKIAGILIENSIEKDNIKQSIAGIGINLNQKSFHSDAPNPVSLNQITQSVYIPDHELDILTDILEYRYSQLHEKDFSTLDLNYAQVLYRIGRTSEYITGNQKFKGTIQGVAASGELIITDENNHERRFLHKEVEFVL